MSSIINRSSIKRYALHCSAKRRAGVFTRVSEDWLTMVEAEVESVIRRVVVSSAFIPLPVEDGAPDWFITGEATKRIEERPIGS